MKSIYTLLKLSCSFFLLVILLNSCTLGFNLARSEALMLGRAGLVQSGARLLVADELALGSRVAASQIVKKGSKRFLRISTETGSEDVLEIINKRTVRTVQSNQTINLPGDLHTVSKASGIVNVRSGPGVNYEIKTKLKSGRPVVVEYTSNGWSKVRVSDDLEGYISRKLLDELEDYVIDEATSYFKNELKKSWNGSDNTNRSPSFSQPHYNNYTPPPTTVKVTRRVDCQHFVPCVHVSPCEHYHLITIRSACTHKELRLVSYVSEYGLSTGYQYFWAHAFDESTCWRPVHRNHATHPYDKEHPYGDIVTYDTQPSGRL